MTLSTNTRDLESQKFKEDVDGNVAVNVTGSITVSGIGIAGQITKVSLNTSTWTKLERSALTSPIGSSPLSTRKALSIQNRSGQDILVQFDENNTDNSIAIIITDGSERFYDLDSAVSIYCKASLGPCDIVFEELS